MNTISTIGVRRDGRLMAISEKPLRLAYSSDHGKTWSEPITISGDGAGHDLGYPSTIQVDDGSLVTVWYEKFAGSTLAVLRQANWRI